MYRDLNPRPLKLKAVILPPKSSSSNLPDLNNFFFFVLNLNEVIVLKMELLLLLSQSLPNLDFWSDSWIVRSPKILENVLLSLIIILISLNVDLAKDDTGCCCLKSKKIKISISIFSAFFRWRLLQRDEPFGGRAACEGCQRDHSRFRFGNQNMELQLPINERL